MIFSKIENTHYLVSFNSNYIMVGWCPCIIDSIIIFYICGARAEKIFHAVTWVYILSFVDPPGYPFQI